MSYNELGMDDLKETKYVKVYFWGAGPEAKGETKSEALRNLADKIEGEDI